MENVMFFWAFADNNSMSWSSSLPIGDGVYIVLAVLQNHQGECDFDPIFFSWKPVCICSDAGTNIQCW
jgi:hypothetical protein